MLYYFGCLCKIYIQNYFIPGSCCRVSPDCLLQQSSTVEDSISFKFSDGITESVPCSYTEFAKRLVLPQYKNLPDTVVKEFHRRDGFEVASADKMAKSCMVYFEMHLSLRKKIITKAFHGSYSIYKETFCNQVYCLFV
ncbi:hypothetical protein JHK86_032476 [Glycine max]|nr:hypothetical protein JHK86_032476 [Glycine max]